MPITGATPLAFTEAFSAAQQATANGTWQDWDLSAIIPTGCVCVFVLIVNLDSSENDVGCRTNGSALARLFETVYNDAVVFPVVPDVNRVIEIYAEAYAKFNFRVIGWLS